MDWLDEELDDYDNYFDEIENPNLNDNEYIELRPVIHNNEIIYMCDSDISQLLAKGEAIYECK